MRVVDLDNAKLDYWVARALGAEPGSYPKRNAELTRLPFTPDLVYLYYGGGMQDYWRPTVTWAQAGQIIERERIAINPAGLGWHATAIGAMPSMSLPIHATGDTALVAAMRCFVVSTLGQEVAEP